MTLALSDHLAAVRLYQQLERYGDVRVAQFPARFVALYQQRGIAKARGEGERVNQLTTVLSNGLDTGEWLLTQRAATHYRDERRLTGVLSE